MISRILQDWISLSTTTRWPAGGDYTIVQSEPDWFRVEELQDASFLVEVRYVFGTPSLVFETAPAAEHRLFQAMVAPLALTGLDSSTTPTPVNAFAHATSGPPLSRYVRWALTSSAGSFDVCFRVTMLGF